jgi:protocatechuate 3,4-dioxygenase beta subunit
VAADGTGETIAIVDAFNDPNIKTDLATFDTAFGLTAPPSFQVLNQTGGTKLPGNAGSLSWALEESLDVEWAHSIAPGANIILLEANDDLLTNLLATEASAASMSSVVVVSNSWGAGEFQGEQAFDSFLTTPAGHQPITFLASTDDSGAPGGYPAYSPNVVAVGGTTLPPDSNGNPDIAKEVGWSLGSDAPFNPLGASGGGISQFETQPSFQHGVVTQSTTFRTIPDVSIDADPNTGVPVCDSYDFGTVTPWAQIGGTSLACPTWAAIVSILDQGRKLEGLPSLDGVKDVLPELYQLAGSDFHDITMGNNGFLAGPGYDLVTGIGTPIANQLVSDIVGAGGVINGQVYFDVNGNGVRDLGEPGLSGWTVFIDINGIGTLQANDPTTTTDAGGYYTFHGLEPGNYTIDEVLQSGWQQVTASPSLVLGRSDIARNVNFGNTQAGKITGEVFQDLSGSGQLASGDTGIANWTVQLEDSSGHVIETAVTDSNGDYTLGAAPGDYSVVAVMTTGWTETTQASVAVSVTSGTIPNIDFGEFQNIDLTGEIFNDLTGSGTLAAGDMGLFDWTVELLDSSQNVVKSTQTDQSGHYALTAGPGSYSLEEVPPSGQGWIQTSPTTAFSFTTVSGQNHTGLNFGNFKSLTISGQVFNDLNGDGIQETGEGGLSGVTVLLENGSGSILSHTMTDSNGDYNFPGQGPGTYQVQIPADSGLIQTTANLPAFSAVSQMNVSNLNIGVAVPAAVAGVVFNDLNGDGTREPGEQGLAGWTVEVLNKSGQVVGQYQTVDSGGIYLIGGLRPGSYVVSESLQSGWSLTTKNSVAFTAVSGQDVPPINFGNFSAISISGQVFDDLNDDGQQQSGENGLAGWTVQLLNTNNAVVKTQVTDQNGNYRFSNLGPGTYRLREVTQLGWGQTTSNPADIPAISGTNDGNINFGDFQTANIVGFVFHDTNGNGVLDAGEGILSGWTVQLVNISTGGVVASMQTDSSGSYAFSSVAAGNYVLQEVTPAGWVQTAAPPTITIVDSTTKINGLEFGNFHGATITGLAFVDDDGSGVLKNIDIGEPAVAIDLFNASTGAFVATTTTSFNGTYSFTGVGPGTYSLQEMVPGGWIQTTSNPANVSTTDNGTFTGENFGNFQLISISGIAFVDASGTGTASGGPGLPGFTIELIKGGVTQTQVTGPGGAYQFSGIGPGQYTIREIPPAGWQQTTHNPVIVAFSGNNLAGVNFGNFHTFNVSGRVFNDLNATGIETSSDPVLAGITVQLYLDRVGNGRLNTAVDPLVASLVSGPDGSYSFDNIGPGIYIVHEARPAGVLVTVPPFANGDYVVSGAGGVVQTGLDFGNLFDPNRGFVYQAYLDLLHRHVDATGMAFWVSELQAGLPRQQVVHDIQQSFEYRALEINTLYQNLLGRPADGAGLGAAVTLLTNLSNIPGTGDPLLQIEANILGSGEYFVTRGGGTINGFLAALYHDALGRGVDPAGAALFARQLAGGTSRLIVAKEILFSTEAEDILVNNLYERYLHRQADAAGIAGFVGALQHGARVDDMIAMLMGSAEYFNNV